MIKITNLSNRKNDNTYIFSDLHIDLQTSKVSNNSTNNNIVGGNDILADVDGKAIQNSIINLLSQKRYLTPKFGVDLKEYIGHPITEMNANSLADSIRAAVALYEPRIKIEKILISTNFDAFTYGIFILLTMPNLDRKSLILSGILDAATGAVNFLNK